MTIFMTLEYISKGVGKIYPSSSDIKWKMHLYSANKVRKLKKIVLRGIRYKHASYNTIYMKINVVMLFTSTVNE